MLKIEFESLPQLNIGIFTDSYRPYVSGVVRSIETFRRDLERLGHRIFVFAPDYPGAKPEKNVFRYLSLPAPTQPDFFFPIPLSFRHSSVVNSIQLDIIHVHTPFLMGTLGAAMARRFNLPLLFTYHTLYQNYTHYVPMGRSISNQLIKRWNKNFCNRCDLIIAPSLFVKELIGETGVNKPVHVIPTGLNLEEYHGNDQNWLKKQYNIDSRERVILHVGRLAREKNIGFILDVVEELLHNCLVPFKLVIVGSGPEENKLKLLCRQKNMENHVIFTGQVTHDELLKCYAGGDIFVFASRTETQGIVLIEAKASGLPAVALDAPCMDGILTNGKDGYLVNSKENFIDNLRFLLENEDKAREMGSYGESNTTSFSAPFLAEKLANVYYYTLLQKKNTQPFEKSAAGNHAPGKTDESQKSKVKR